MTKIIFNETAAKGVREVIDFSSDASKKIAARANLAVKPDVYSSNTKIITPFYNRFLPERFCRYKEVSFFPNSKMVKHIDTYNGKGEAIRLKSFDETGVLTFDEKINPKTNYVKTMLRSDGEIIEQEMQGSILLRKEVRDYDGNISYKYEFNPLKAEERIVEINDGVTTIIKKCNKEEVFRHVKTPDGEIRETVNDNRRGLHYYYEAGIITRKDGSKTQTPKFKRLTIRENNSETSSVYEFLPEENRYSYKVYNDKGAQVGETKYLHSEQIRSILERISGLI